MLKEVMEHEPRPLRQVDETLPGELECICGRAMAGFANDRYSSAFDLAEDLRMFLASGRLNNTAQQQPSDTSPESSTGEATASQSAANSPYSNQTSRRTGEAWDAIQPGSAGVRPVGLKRPNQFGLVDIPGNVSEWCEDSYMAYHRIVRESVPEGSPGIVKDEATRVFRGAGIGYQARFCRSAQRSHQRPTDEDLSCGFRVIRTLRPILTDQ